jgi:NAD(P) transhydrogenase subunit beta
VITHEIAAYGYLIAAICFIMALRGLSSPVTSRGGNLYGIVGMVIAIGVTVASPGVVAPWLIIGGLVIGGAIGAVVAMRIQMTALPQLVAAFHSLVGLAAVFVAAAAFISPDAFGIGTPGKIKMHSLIEMGLGTVIGAITFTGSIVAFAKLQGLVSGSPLVFRGQHPLNALLGIILVVLLVWFALRGHPITFVLLIVLSLLIGFLLILPIGGADMPVVVSMLNSYSGWAAAGIGFTLGNTALIVTGALVGSSGAILSYIMCKGMNRSIFNVILGGFGTDTSAAGAAAVKHDKPVKAGSAEDAAFLMKNAQSVIIVPGYGMAVAQAQHALREMADILKKDGVQVRYAIHPVAGRMPGHMNVLLAEADVPYEQLKEMDQANSEFGRTDVSLVIGANDVTNPDARSKADSPIYGMPILNVDESASVIVLKRSMNSGFAGIDNPLFYDPKTAMLFGDAKASVNEITEELKAL